MLKDPTIISILFRPIFGVEQYRDDGQRNHSNITLRFVVDAGIFHVHFGRTGVRVMEPETTGDDFKTVQVIAENPIVTALADSGVPKLYTNGFQIFHTDSDTGIVFMRVGEPIAVLFMSDILSKTLAQKLGHAMGEREMSLGSTFAVTDELKKAREIMAKTKEEESGDNDSGT